MSRKMSHRFLNFARDYGRKSLRLHPDGTLMPEIAATSSRKKN